MPCYRLTGEMEGDVEEKFSAYPFTLMTVNMGQPGHGSGMASGAGG